MNWEQREMKKRKAKEAMVRNLQMFCVIFVVPYFIGKCYLCKMLFELLDTFIDRKYIKYYFPGDNLEHYYNIILYCVIAHIALSVSLPIYYVFNLHTRFLSFFQIVCIVMPLQFCAGTTAFVHVVRVLPLFAANSYRVEFFVTFALIEIICIGGHPAFVVLAFIIGDPPKTLTGLELEVKIIRERKKEMKEKAMRRARNKAQAVVQ